LRYRLTWKWRRVGVASIFGFFFFLETGAYFDKNGTQPGEIAFTSVLLVVIAWFTVRAARSATLLTNDVEVTVRGIYRTRSWSWDEVDGFVADTKLIGPYVKYRRRVLGMRYRDGTIRWFPELSCRPAQGDGRSRVDDAADTLNHYLSSSQSRSAASLPRPT
jgi:hypothetical protein